MQQRRYVLYPGQVRSQSDGEARWITSNELARLYGIPLSECVVVDERDPKSRLFETAISPALIRLRPRSDGNYEETRLQLSEAREKERMAGAGDN